MHCLEARQLHDLGQVNSCLWAGRSISQLQLCHLCLRDGYLVLFLAFVFGHEYPSICGLEKCKVSLLETETRLTL